jgi:DNA-binding NarL/FixJ family response regulator
MRILITDDHQLFADGLCLVLEDIAEVTNCDVAPSAEEALAILDKGTKFDLMVVDLHLPGIDGVSLLSALLARRSNIPVVVISATDSVEEIIAALNRGAKGFIPKSFDRENIQAALRTIMAGEKFIPAELSEKIARIEQSKCSFPELPDDVTSLGITKRQFDVLKYVAKGYSNKQIANSLFLTEHTIKVHIKALFKSLRASNRTQLVQIAEGKSLLH